MELALSICLGLGLSAACGFRVFVPLLGVSTAALAGHLHLAYGFEWLGTWPAFACFLTATILEIVAYYVPWLDNLLDSVATPAAVVAGTIATASVITDMSPLLQWSLAIIAGGGTAGVIQSATVLVRGALDRLDRRPDQLARGHRRADRLVLRHLAVDLLPILAVALAAVAFVIAVSILGRFRRRPEAVKQVAAKAA